MLKYRGNLSLNRFLFLPALISVCSVLLTLFILFTLFEVFPSLLNKLPLESIRYYAQKKKFRPDNDLVFVRRSMQAHRESYVFIGSMYRKEYGGQAPVINYTASYDANGFRTNSSQAPYEVVIIGDSYVEIGESDDQTLSEQLKAYSGFRTCNLGREWYGPYQYVKVLRRYALDLKPRFALFCFFSGNDIMDIQQYENWLQGGDYHNFTLSRSFLGRFRAVLSDIGFAINSALKETMGLRRVWTKVWMNWHNEKVPPNLGIANIGGQQVPMGFGHWNPTGTPDELLNRNEWVTLRMLIANFKGVCYQHEILPVVVYIPHKTEVYAEMISDQSGRNVRNRLANQLASMDNSVTAFRRITAELSIDLLDLTATFREAAGKGTLLYFPFDTHWNPRGRLMAAQLIANELRRLEARGRLTGCK